MSIAPEDIQPSFDSNARRYRCCCGCGCHVRVCAKIIASLEAIAITIACVSNLIEYIHYRTGGNHPKPPPHEPKNELRYDPFLTANESQRNETQLGLAEIIRTNPDLLFAIYAFFFVIVWIAVILVFFGINRIRPKCLLPHLFLQSLSVLYALIMTVVYAVQQAKWSVLSFPTRPALIFYSLASVLEIYFFVCVYRCYRYLKAKRRAAPITRFEKQQPMEEGGAGAPT